ncbi:MULTISPECIES: dTDP-4-dehydrorhamnose reductase [unclassified Rhodosalinus]|uniref:dTDP-4-dehydrorhamnose reductase n=1 Tax=unclassified Rhodosalinus TaxID=2630183 RepID=UPI00352555C7
MTVLVFGADGQVGRELAALPGVVALDRAAADLSRPGACAQVIREARPGAVINAAAYTAVDRAEEEEALATVVNGEAPGAMACAAAELGIPFVHISTDYVFAGTGDRPWRPADEAHPVSAYGRSKLAGEAAIRAAGGTWAILRTSWVFAGRGRNFVATILRLSADRDRLAIVADQVGGPTPASAIAEATHLMASRLVDTPALGGLYHFSGAPDVSWAGFARAILAATERDVEVEEITTAQFPTPARRPQNSRLDCSEVEAVFGIKRPDWRAALPEVVYRLENGRA